MSNTNDPQAPYSGMKWANTPIFTNMYKPTERAPLLSDEGLIEVHSTADFPDTVFVKVRGRKGGFTMPRSSIEFVEGLAAEMEAAIRAKITSGELRVVKKATLKVIHEDCVSCSNCLRLYGERAHMPPKEGQYCTCGAQIVKE